MVLHTRDTGPDAGTARLWIVVPVTMFSFFYVSILEYALPLYFGALSTAAEARGGSFPGDLYSQLMKYQITPWFFMPLVAGLCSRRYGERRVWCFSQVAMVVIPFTLIVYPNPTAVKAVAFWSGVTGALLWISGVSLIQMVRPERKGLSNGLLMGSMGLGSFIAPLCGRGVVYWPELQAHLAGGEWSLFGKKLSALEPTTMMPQVENFLPIFWFLVALKAVCGVLVGVWSQHPGQFVHDDESPSWDRTITDLKRLIVNARFWALVIALCLLGGPMFQATNLYLPYRAGDLGLIQGSADQGWVWLKLLGTMMWIPGGLSVGLLAGRRAPGIVAVAMLGCFSFTGLSIGLSSAAWQLFLFYAMFEFVRQSMRWSHAGYVSEHMPQDLRATAIGCSITISGLGSAVFAWIAGVIWKAGTEGFQSSRPFVAAAALGCIGCIGLYVFDRLRPIRMPSQSS